MVRGGTENGEREMAGVRYRVYCNTDNTRNTKIVLKIIQMIPDNTSVVPDNTNNTMNNTNNTTYYQYYGILLVIPNKSKISR
jgi:hypothetical protein